MKILGTAVGVAVMVVSFTSPPAAWVAPAQHATDCHLPPRATQFKDAIPRHAPGEQANPLPSAEDGNVFIHDFKRDKWQGMVTATAGKRLKETVEEHTALDSFSKQKFTVTLCRGGEVVPQAKDAQTQSGDVIKIVRATWF